ncbi:MAG: PKD domain-containing protein [Saprospiraceae bacterium]|nr:PKD domain-containing protein [Saprospiraceae bacterium]
MKILSFILVFMLHQQLTAQQLRKVAPTAGETLPGWAMKMYEDHPNVWQVDDEYRIWRQTNPQVKTTYTQYYKKWRRAVEPYINAQGYEEKPTQASIDAFNSRLEKLKINGAPRGTAWSNIGPFETFNTNTGPSPLAKSEQANIYCIDQSLSHPDIVYCGTEGAEIFKSIDKGLNWTCVSRAYEIGAPGALEVHPTNPDIVFVGENNNIRRSTDGGATWELVLSDNEMWTNDILINPGNDLIVLAATQHGLYRSEDGGTTWDRLLNEPCYDLEWKPNDPSLAYLVRNDPAAGICRFYKSTDAGLNWNLKDNGWFFSDQEGRYDGGARLAVTKADPNRIYAVLIGEAKTDDSGFIGIWRSDDAGESWTLPNPPAGGPWNEVTHPNMATIGRTGGYHQGFYNLGFDASDVDPDFVMAGFLNLWVSIDGGQTFSCDGGYCGNNFNYVHPDCQEIEINGTDIWMTSDGGIEYSNDHFVTHYALNRGITSADYWGFGTGWNEDILVGGRYHNGNSAWHENWLPGEHLGLGGGEAPTGYVNPGEGRLTYYSDLGGVELPESQNGYARYFPFSKFPIESYYDAESGEMEWDPRSWNTFYVTNQNKIWKTTNGGNSFLVLHTFDTLINANAMSFEISRSNPQVMYLFQRDDYSWDPGRLWKTADGGETWTELSFPPGYARRGLLACSAEDENRIWLAFPDSGDGEKIYTSYDGGENWVNLTTAALNGEHITYILHQGGTDGGLYLGTYRSIWFKDDNIAEWMPYNDGLPKQIATCILRPFYRDNKLRIGAYGKGIWEAPFVVASRPVAQPMVQKRETTCPGDMIQFDDYSMMDHEGATWAWEFDGGVPSTSTLRNPAILYPYPGTYDVTLTVQNPKGISTKTIEGMIEVLQPLINEVPPLIDFSTTEHFTIVNPDNGITWSPVTIDRCNPDGDVAYYVNNYDYSGYGIDDIMLPVNLDLTQVMDPALHFNVAYAPYYDGNAFIDSLKVMISNNCATTFTTLFRSGGEALSTTSSGEGPNNLYEYERFSPQNCEEWRPVTLDLSDYAGQYVTIKFVNQSGYGNNMHLDNIWLETTLVSTEGTVQGMAISLQPNPTSGHSIVTGQSSQAEHLQLSIHTPSGIKLFDKKILANMGSWQEAIDLSGYQPGVYFVKIFSDHGDVWTEKVVRQ